MAPEANLDSARRGAARGADNALTQNGSTADLTSTKSQALSSAYQLDESLMETKSSPFNTPILNALYSNRESQARNNRGQRGGRGARTGRTPEAENRRELVLGNPGLQQDPLQPARDLVKQMKVVQERLISYGGGNIADESDPNTDLGKWVQMSRELRKLTGHKVTTTSITAIRRITGSQEPTKEQIRQVLNDKLEAALKTAEKNLENGQRGKPPRNTPPSPRQRAGAPSDSRRRDSRREQPREPAADIAVEPTEPPLTPEPSMSEPGMSEPSAPKVEPTPEPKPEPQSVPEPKTEPESQPEPEEFLPEEVEKNLDILDEIRELGQEKMLQGITAAQIKKHYEDGTLMALALGIESHDKRNEIENDADPDGEYEERLERFHEDVEQLKEKVARSTTLSREELLSKLQGEKFGSFFQREEVDPAQIDFDALTKDQLHALHEICLIEEQVREADITYRADAPVGSTIGEPRYGDCNTTALYYAGLASAACSEHGKGALSFLNGNVHSQVIITLGRDKNGNEVEISKNTSYVDMKNVGADGRSTKGAPYIQNFNDPASDYAKYAVDPSVGKSTIVGLVSSIMVEATPELDYKNATEEELKADYRNVMNLNQLNPYGSTNLSNMITNISVQWGKGMLTDNQVEQFLEPIAERYIKANILSAAFQIENMRKKFGEHTIVSLSNKLEQHIIDNEDNFRQTMRAPVNEVGLRNRYNALVKMFRCVDDKEVISIIQEEFTRVEARYDEITKGT